MTGFWVFMLIMCLLTPAMMIGFGKYFMKGGAKQINGVFGYRTTRSMKNQETWRFAHQYSGKIWHRSGLFLLPVSHCGDVICLRKECRYDRHCWIDYRYCTDDCHDLRYPVY